MRKEVLKYVMTTVFAVVMTLLFAQIRGAFKEGATESELLIAWCDGFFVSGTAMLCFGLLTFSSREGVFDGLVYTLKSTFSAIFRPKLKEESYETYKKERAGRSRPFLHLVIVGAVFILIATVIYIIYSNK